MNFITCAIRVFEFPEIKLYQNKIPYLKFNVELVPGRKIKNITMIKAEIWGDLVYDLAKYYSINDYLIIEGYFSTFYFKNNTNQMGKKKAIKLHINRFYPFLLTNSNC